MKQENEVKEGNSECLKHETAARTPEKSSGTSDSDDFCLTELSQKLINLNNLIRSTPVNERKQLTKDKNQLLEEFANNSKLEIKDLFHHKDSGKCNASNILENWKWLSRHTQNNNNTWSSSLYFQSKLFITPPKINGLDSKSPSPSPLLDVMNSLNNLLEDDNERK